VSAVPGLKGYVGVDLVLTEDNPVFIEVNARITTSYTGLHRVLRVQGRKGVANAIINAAINGDLPSHVEAKGYAYYAKFLLKPDIRINKEMIEVLSNLEYVESPPLSERGGTKEAFLVSEGNSLNEALEAKSRNEKKLDKIARKFMGPSPES
jgi:predicted ATP-grasp superfamily ATP-dependent carboligase